MSSGPARGARGPYSKSAHRRTEIVDAAITVFGSRGYHGGSLREISREMGMSLPAVTHHFPSKSDLLLAVLESTDREGEDFDRSGGTIASVLGLIEQNFSRPELLRVLAIVSAESSAPDHPAHDWFVKRYERVRRFHQEGIETDQSLGRISPERDPAFLADCIIALWDGLQLQWLIDPRVDMTARMRDALKVLVPEAFEEAPDDSRVRAPHVAEDETRAS